MTKDYRKLIHDKMYGQDLYSQQLGMHIVSVDLGQAVVDMTVEPSMCNGFNIAHGSIAYALADSAAAFAANTHDGIAVTVDNRIAYHAPIKRGAVISATATERSRSRRLAHYEVKVMCEDTLVATMESTLYITGL